MHGNFARAARPALWMAGIGLGIGIPGALVCSLLFHESNLLGGWGLLFLLPLFLGWIGVVSLLVLSVAWLVERFLGGRAKTRDAASESGRDVTREQGPPPP